MANESAVTVQPVKLTVDSKERKETPIYSGLLNYFPLACAAVARVSFKGNKKHNPGTKLHWDRNKSTDHADCIARHLIEQGGVDADGELHEVHLAWRALALAELAEERRLKYADTYRCFSDPVNNACFITNGVNVLGRFNLDGTHFRETTCDFDLVSSQPEISVPKGFKI